VEGDPRGRGLREMTTGEGKGIMSPEMTSQEMVLREIASQEMT